VNHLNRESSWISLWIILIHEQELCQIKTNHVKKNISSKITKFFFQMVLICRDFIFFI